METRCGSCNKLFRVSDDKITGTGIKFPCTRCGEYVKITKQDFEHYTLSLTAVSVLDMFEPKPKPVKPPVLPAAEPVSRETVPTTAEAKTFDFSELSSDQEMPEELPPPFAEPDHSPTPMAAAEPLTVVKPQPQPVTAPEIKTAPSAEPKPKPEPIRESKPLSVAEPKTALPSEKQLRPAPARPAAQDASLSARPVQPALPKKDQVRPVVQPEPEQTEKATLPSSQPSHAGRMILVLLATLIIGALAAYGVFVYLNSPSQQGNEAVHQMTSVKGVQIVNPAGSVEQNGDLLVTGVIENTTDKEVAAWYVVVEVYDSQSAILTKLRFLNGKQIYSRRDFDILEKRGMNVQELKAKYLQDKGAVLPPKGSLNFEMRYLQPPAGIASINPLVLPFDPVQLYKEIAEEMK